MAGGIVAVTVRGGALAPTTAPPPKMSTATVHRTDLTTTILTEGDLGYVPTTPVVNRLAGTYTQLPPPGASIGFGQILYRVDNSPVVLMQGGTPAWRPFAPGMADGPDVRDLQSNLIAWGFAHGLLSQASGFYDADTVAAVERWQLSTGIPETGEVGLGQVLFLHDPIIISSTSTSIGQPATPGEVPIAATTAVRSVTVPLNATLPTVTVGEVVSIILPTNGATPGVITAVAPAPVSSSTPATTSPSQSTPVASFVATVAPSNPSATGSGANIAVQVSLTVATAHNVLALPIAALLALVGGGYGVEVVTSSGVHHLVGVSTGTFTGSQVEVSGEGIAAGTKVVVAQ